MNQPLTPAQLQKALDSCNRCGFCQEVCPTYAHTKQEPQVARGRVRLARMVREGELSWSDDPELTAQVDNCLLCGACVSVCPSGVPTDAIMLNARQDIRRQEGFDLFHRLVYRGLLSHGKRLEMLARLLKLGDTGDLRGGLTRSLVRKASERLHYLATYLPDTVEAPARAVLPRVNRAQGKRLFKVGLFIGCASNVLLPRVPKAAVAYLTHAGCEVHIPSVACCGGPHHAAGDEEAAWELMRRNVALLAKQDYDYLLTDCATCGHTLHVYPQLLPPTDAAQTAARELAAKVMDLNHFLVDVLPAPEKLARRDQVVTYHDPCHAVRGLGEKDAPRQVLGMVPGLKLKEMVGADSCCGGAGSYWLSHAEMSGRILETKLARASETGASIVATSCPSCTLQLMAGARRAGLPLDVRHPVELLAASAGL